MQESKEKKIFFGVLWLYLAGALIFFISFLSLDKVYLPGPVWLMFLLVTVGFIVFMVIPLPGRGVPGRADRGTGWYPRNLSQILEGREPEAVGLRPPVSSIPPVPLLPLILLLIAVLLAMPSRMTEEAWSEHQAEHLGRVYERVAEDIVGIEQIIRDVGAGAADIYAARFRGDEPADPRPSIFYALDSLAASVDRRLVPFKEVGVQLFSGRGDLIAWGGRPLYRKPMWAEAGQTKVFTSRTMLFRLIVSVTPLEGGGWAIVDMPLEVNYRISNRYLKSATLGELLGERYGTDIRLNLGMGEHDGEIRWQPKEAEEKRRIAVGAAGGVQIDGFIESLAGQPLASVTIRGKDLAVERREREQRRVFWAGLVVTITVVVIGIWAYRSYYRRYRGEIPRLWKMLVRIGVFAGFLFLSRFLLLELDLSSELFRSSLFDPALFADASIPFGLTRTAGDLLITAVFALVLVFGSTKIFRTYNPGYLERGFTGRAVRLPLVIAKGVACFILMAGSVRLVAGIVSRVVLNSNPRLLGLTINFLDPPVIVMHLALLFMVSAVFIAVLCLVRLVLLWRNGGLAEAVVSSAIAVAGVLAVVGLEPLQLVGITALALLSIKIFPLVSKEDVISVVFGSFFLVLIATVFIYDTAADRYVELGKSRILEKAQDFNYPEDNWLQLILFDVCQDIAHERSIPPKMSTSKESMAFEIWAESALSGYYVSCVIDVYDGEGASVSRFSVGTPYEPPPFSRVEELDREGLIVEQVEQMTKDGVIHSFKGIAAVTNTLGERIGRVEITIPYFFENPELLSRSGPVAPEILHNIERGAIAPRIDDPENLIVALMEGTRVIDSSDPKLFAGSVIDTEPERWGTLDIGGEKYHSIVKLREDGRGFLVGFRRAGFLEELLTWATIVSLDVMLMIISLVATMLVHRLPLVRSVTPAIAFRGGLGFRQKVLLSFLFVSIVPVLILGTLSSQFIERRFKAEAERQALEDARSAVSLINHSIVAEAEAFSGSQYLRDILSGDTDARIRDVALYEKTQFTLFDEEGRLLLDESLSDFDSTEVLEIMGATGSGKVLVRYDFPYLYGGVTIPLAGENTGALFYRRRIDDEFIESIAEVMGANVNVYYGGEIRASSQRELFAGGFLDPLLDPIVFADIALMRSKAAVRDEFLGDYAFQVASTPLLAIGGDEAAVLSIPLLYQPALVRREILRASALILGLLVLLFAATVTIGVFLAGKIFNPIAALQAGTRRIIQGDLEFKLEADAMDELGELVSSFNTMTEALREARRNLLERQRYLTAILDSLATGVITTDGEGRVMTINASGERILEIEGEQIEGRGADELERMGLRPLSALFTAGDEPVRESEFTIFSGEKRRTLKAVVTSLVEGGENLGAVVVFDDLTELIRSKKLAAWVEMARQIAHEVKNPLTPIRLSAQLMKRAHDAGAEDFDEIFSSGVETVIQQTEILRRIASEFSSFGRTGNLSLEAIPVARFLEDFTAAYRGAERVRITVESTGEAVCLADRESLRKILVNLVENALDAMQHVGEIVITSEARDGFAWIGVIDSGPGLSPEIEERLFEPYFSTKTNGTGLGLAISQSLAREMEGEMRITNRTGSSGVEATLKLPLAHG